MTPDAAAVIKSTLTMAAVADKYGLSVNAAGFCKCPFHGNGTERTASMKIYPGQRGWHCFGCHEGGSIIDFVMRFFDLPFRDAVKKLNADFGLGLSMEKPNREEMRRLAIQQAARREEQRQREIQIARLSAKADVTRWMIMGLESDTDYWHGIQEQYPPRLIDPEQGLYYVPPVWDEAALYIDEIQKVLEPLKEREEELDVKLMEISRHGG